MVDLAVSAPKPWYREPYVLLTTFSALFLVLAWLAGHNNLGTALAITSTLAGAFYAVQSAAESIRARQVDVNILMILAAIGAAAIHEFLDGAVLIFLFSLSNTLERFTMARTQQAIRALLKLRPSIAWVRTPEGDIERPVSELTVSDVIVVKPGELVPVDAEVIEGRGSVDEAAMTGEAMPVDKSPGESLIGGTMNIDNVLVAKVTRPASESALAKVIRLVQEAQEAKTGDERVSTWIGRWYTLIVLVGFGVYLAIELTRPGVQFHPAFYRAVTLLVAASPCALVLSTPSAVLSALANCARRGILVRGGKFLEIAAKVKVVAMDKTGTLTRGRFDVVDIIVHPENGEAARDDLLRKVASVEGMVRHPLSSAMVSAAASRGLQLPIACDMRNIPGRGVEGTVNGDLVRAGREALFNGQLPKEIVERIHQFQGEGKTVVAVMLGGRSGVIALKDTIRPSTVESIRAIRAMGVEHVVMLTGDHAETATVIASESGIDEFHAGLMPGDKSEVINRLRLQYGPVAMVGDGINDAPSLASADLGIAMGGIGSDVALETADVVLMNDRFELIPDLFRLSRRAMRVVRQNLTISMLSLVTLITLALTVGIALPYAVVGHEMTTVLVMLNGVRLLAVK